MGKITNNFTPAVCARLVKLPGFPRSPFPPHVRVSFAGRRLVRLYVTFTLPL